MAPAVTWPAAIFPTGVRSVPELLTATGLHKWYPVRRGLIGYVPLKAVDGVDLSLAPGEVLGLLGESGCGKSTLGRLLVRLEEPTSGRIHFGGADVTRLQGKSLKPFRRRAQIVFQNPFESLDPRYTLRAALMDPLVIHGIAGGEELVAAILRRAHLEPVEHFLDRHPHELSGGQLQRVAMARAMLLEPDFVVADEPVSMLDVSVRAEVLNFLLDLRADRGTAFLFITHDIGVARYVCDRIVVMYLGRVVEEGPADEVIRNPRHPYTAALVASAPDLETTGKGHPTPSLAGEVLSPVDLPRGCRFANRCPQATGACRENDPVLGAREGGRRVACHLA